MHRLYHMRKETVQGLLIYCILRGIISLRNCSKSIYIKISFITGLDCVHMFGYNYCSIYIKNMQLRRSERGCNDMAENVINDVKQTKENDNRALDIAMFHFNRFASAERRKQELEEKEKKKEEELRRMRSKKRKAERLLEDAETELAVIRKFAGVSREKSNIRKQYAVKCFFDLISLLDSTGTRDVTDAYNFIGNTEWLAGALMQATVVSGDKSKVTIDAIALRKAIFAKKAEMEKAIADAKQVLDKEWKLRHKDSVNPDADKVASGNSDTEDTPKPEKASAQHGSYKNAVRATYKPAEHGA